MRRGIGRLRAGGGGFNPLSLFAAGAQGAWYDPSDFSTMFQDSAGTTPVTAATQPVGKILDKSGNGNHATQSTTTSRPLLQQDGSGNFYLQPDGVDDNMASSAFTMPSTATMAAAILFTNAAASIGNVFDGLTLRMIIGAQTGNTYRFFNGAVEVNGGTRDAAAHVLLGNFVGAGSTLEVDASTVASGTSPGTNGLTGGLRLFADNLGTSQFMSGRFYGAIALARALTAAEKASLYTYLGRKAGLSL